MLTWLALAQQGSAAAAGARRRSGAGNGPYSLTLVDDGEFGTGVQFQDGVNGSVTPSTFSGKAIIGVYDFPAGIFSASFVLQDVVASNFVTSVTINGVTLLTSAASGFDTSGGLSSTWSWDMVNWVNATPGTYVMVVT